MTYNWIENVTKLKEYSNDTKDSIKRTLFRISIKEKLGDEAIKYYNDNFSGKSPKEIFEEKIKEKKEKYQNIAIIIIYIYTDTNVILNFESSGFTLETTFGESWEEKLPKIPTDTQRKEAIDYFGQWVEYCKKNSIVMSDSDRIKQFFDFYKFPKTNILGIKPIEKIIEIYNLLENDEKKKIMLSELKSSEIIKIYNERIAKNESYKLKDFISKTGKYTFKNIGFSRSYQHIPNRISVKESSPAYWETEDFIGWVDLLEYILETQGSTFKFDKKLTNMDIKEIDEYLKKMKIMNLDMSLPLPIIKSGMILNFNNDKLNFESIKEKINEIKSLLTVVPEVTKTELNIDEELKF